MPNGMVLRCGPKGAVRQYRLRWVWRRRGKERGIECEARSVRDAGFTYLHARIVTEYIEVLHLPAFPFSRNEVAALTALIEAGGVLASPVPLAERLPDIDDEPFLEVAIAARAGCLVTGNRDHFPPNRQAGVRVVSPRERRTEYSAAGIMAGEEAQR